MIEYYRISRKEIKREDLLKKIMEIIKSAMNFEPIEDEIQILKYILEKNVQLDKPMCFGCNQRGSKYEIVKDTGELVDFCMKNTKYKTLEEITDILVILEQKTDYFKIAGSIENGSPIDLNISPIGAVRLFEKIQIEVIYNILIKLNELYNSANGIIKLSSKPMNSTDMAFEDFYSINAEDFGIPMNVFKLLFFGLKELGYITGLGNYTSLASNDLKLSGLGIRVVKELQEKGMVEE